MNVQHRRLFQFWSQLAYLALATLRLGTVDLESPHDAQDLRPALFR